MKTVSRGLRPRTAICAVFAAALAGAVLAPTFASGSYGTTPTAGSGTSVATIDIVGSRKSPLKFVAPATVTEGQELRIVNQTSAKQVGPHTFSLVEKSVIPTTAQGRHVCFTPNHICKDIAAWHGSNGKGPVKTDPAKAGAAGWDTLGSLSNDGDSWFTGSKPNASFEQPVTADTSAGPTTLYFMCAVHPWMHGSIVVLPAAGS